MKFFSDDEIIQYGFEATNFDLNKIQTPVDVTSFKNLFKQSNYPKLETDFLIEGFSKGFRIMYEGNQDRTSTAPNLKLRVGSEQILWDKLMKEVKLGRVAGPYKGIPYQAYIQSPIGLVPKQQPGETKTHFPPLLSIRRLIEF